MSSKHPGTTFSTVSWCLSNSKTTTPRAGPATCYPVQYTRYPVRTNQTSFRYKDKIFGSRSSTAAGDLQSLPSLAISIENDARTHASFRKYYSQPQRCPFWLALQAFAFPHRAGGLPRRVPGAPGRRPLMRDVIAPELFENTLR